MGMDFEGHLNLSFKSIKDVLWFWFESLKGVHLLRFLSDITSPVNMHPRSHSLWFSHWHKMAA